MARTQHRHEKAGQKRIPDRPTNYGAGTSTARARGASGPISQGKGSSMRKLLLGSVFASSLLFAAAPAMAQFGGGGCTYENMDFAAKSYLAAQSTGEPLKMPMGLWVNYSEQGELHGMGGGIISKPMKIDFYREILDPDTCQAFVEAVVTDKKDPYVLGTYLQVRGTDVNNVEILATNKDDWLFNASRTMAYSKAEDWGIIPEKDRDSRETLQAAADAYLDLFSDKSVKVPWGHPCARLEGGIYTGKGKPGEATPEDTCDVGVPSNIKMADRRYIIDPSIGAVTVLLKMGPHEEPDAHTFRIEHGKIRYVHTITVCKEEHCGFKYDAKTLAALANDNP